LQTCHVRCVNIPAPVVNAPRRRILNGGQRVRLAT
jgi:hypothetical protein